MNIKVGDRVAVRANGHSVTRTVEQIGEGYVVVWLHNQMTKVPHHWITSHMGR